MADLILYDYAVREFADVLFSLTLCITHTFYMFDHFGKKGKSLQMSVCVLKGKRTQLCVCVCVPR